MIITCPQCGARYKVKDGLIQERGKKVKCKKCETVFIAYPDNRTEIKSTGDPTASSPAPGGPAPGGSAPGSPAPGSPAIGNPTAGPSQDIPVSRATIKIDRGQLENYIKQSQGDEQIAEPAPIPPPPTPHAASAGNQATIQVDRSQIEAFIQQAREGGPPSADATVQVDRSQIDAALRGMPETPTDLAPSSPPQPPFPANISDTPIPSTETIKIDPDNLAQALRKGQEPSAPLSEPPGIADAEPATTHEIDRSDDLPDFGFDESDTPQPDAVAEETPEPIAAEPQTGEPAFPTDQELGIEDDFDFGDDAAQPLPVAPVVETTPEQPSVQLYTAHVEGKLYPNLTMEILGRWIQEGRLLEGDEIEDNAGQRQRADAYPEIQPYFAQFAQNAAERAPAPEKKGFFSRLFSGFRK